MVTNRKAPESVCRELAEACDEYRRNPDSHSESGTGARYDQALAAYRAATAPLRTRASVDAEIAQRVRKLHAHCDPEECSEPDLLRLCSEPTADEPTYYPTTAGCHWCRKVAPVTPVGWDNICAECLARGEKPSGSSSTPAAKESRDNAGVPAGPANEPLEDPEPCSCGQALELQRIISHVHALALELVQVTETTPG